MRKTLWLLLLLGFFACKNEKTNTADTASNEPVEVDLNSLTGSAAAPLAPGDNRETRILTNNFWVIEFYVSSTEGENKSWNRGRWYQFNKDGTFASGHWDKQTAYGTWTVDYTPKYPLVVIDSYNDAEDCAWHMQGVTPDESEMSMVGGEGYSNYADMVKAINLMTMPTKKQFGDE